MEIVNISCKVCFSRDLKIQGTSWVALPNVPARKKCPRRRNYDCMQIVGALEPLLPEVVVGSVNGLVAWRVVGCQG